MKRFILSIIALVTITGTASAAFPNSFADDATRAVNTVGGKLFLGNGWFGHASSVLMHFATGTESIFFNMYYSTSSDYAGSNFAFSTGISDLNCNPYSGYMNITIDDVTGYDFNPAYYYYFSPLKKCDIGTHGIFYGGTSTIGEWFDETSMITDSFTPYMVFNGDATEFSSTLQDEISFAYPEQSSTVNLFSPYLLRAAYLNPLDTYRVTVNWYATKNGTSTVILNSNKANTIYGLGRNFMLGGISVPRTDWGFDMATDTIVYASAQLYDTQDPTNSGASLAFPILTASTSEFFYLLAIPASNGNFSIPRFSSGTEVITTSTRPVGAVENPTFQVGSGCDMFDSGGETPMFTDPVNVFGFDTFRLPSQYFVAGTLCGIGEFANDFVAASGKFGNGTVDTLAAAVNKIFPLSVRAAIRQDIDDAETQAAVIGSITIDGHGSVLTGRHIDILTSSTLNWIPEETGFDLKGFLDKIIYIFTAVFCLVPTFAVGFKIMHGSSSS